jgi:hypothetical protein
MDIELTNQEKLSIINQHIKSIVTNIYNLNVAIISESSLAQPNQENLDNLNDELQKANTKKQALLQEYATISGS